MNLEWLDFDAGRAVDVDGDGLVDMTLLPEGSASSFTSKLTARLRDGSVSPFTTTVPGGCASPDMDVTSDYGQRFLADMDGDGLADIVVVQPSARGPFDPIQTLSFLVFPNRGDGSFGVPGGSGAEGCQTSSGSAIVDPTLDLDFHAMGGTVIGDSELADTLITLADLNGDDLADFSAITPLGLEVCLRSFTEIASGAPNASPTQWSCKTWSAGDLGVPDGGTIQTREYQTKSNLGDGYTIDWGRKTNVQPADIDGLGFQDLAFSLAQLIDWNRPSTATQQKVSVNAGASQGLLRTISNGKGVTTAIGYESANRPGLALPVPIKVVSAIATNNGLTGLQQVSTQANYTYELPHYDAREKVFTGFGKVDVKTSGAAGAPGTVVHTQFATEDCQTVGLCTNLVDYSYFHALRGIPAAIEEDDATNSQRLRTTWNEYKWDVAYTGLDERRVLTRWLWQQHVYLWEGQTPQFASLDIVASLSAGPEIYLARPTSGAELRRQVNLDAHGNEASTIDFGNVTGGDRIIISSQTWQLPPGDTSGWSWRMTSAEVGYGSAGGQITGPPRVTSAEFDALGRLTASYVALTGSLSLLGPGGAPRAAGTPPEASGSDHAVLQHAFLYDDFGNVIRVREPNDRCLTINYDLLFHQLPTSVTAFSAGCGTGALTTLLDYDRGLGKLTQKIEPTLATTKWHYDGFGRVTQVDEPDALMRGASSLALKATYVDTLPLRRVSVMTATGLPHSNTFQQHEVFKDGSDDVVGLLDAAGEPGDGKWRVSHVHRRYFGGRMAQQYLPFFVYGNTTAWTSPGMSPSVSSQYDALGRVVAATDANGNTTSTTYHPASLSAVSLDPEQGAGGTHRGSSSKLVMNGHGERVAQSETLAHGSAGSGQRTTSYGYQATGELESVTVGGPGASYSRWLQYDSLGRLVFNGEPNTAVGFSTSPGAGGVAGWTYAYNDNGDLVGTADARGCGKNIYYDAAGRMIAEDYSPCTPSQPAYSPADPSTGDGTESFVRYDAGGRVLVTYDRAQRTFYAYDPRDRVSTLTRNLAAPDGATVDSLAERYAPHAFVKSFSYLETNQVTTETTGCDVPALSPNGSEVDTTYTLEGAVSSVASSYGSLVTSQEVDASGSALQRVLGDAAKTTVNMDYDGTEALIELDIVRTPGPWIPASASYMPPSSSDPDDTIQG
ncbi:MAG: toxin TcdB middle/N-terminal domain-containing protein, partial [Polyangiaceae bacterium]